MIILDNPYFSVLRKKRILTISVIINLAEKVEKS